MMNAAQIAMEGESQGHGPTVLDFTPYLNVPFSPWLVLILGAVGVVLVGIARNAISSAIMWTLGMIGCACFLVAGAMGFMLGNYETQGWKPAWLAPHFSLTAEGKETPSNDESQRWRTPSGAILDHCTAHETIDHSLSLHPFKGHYSLTCRDISTGKNVAITKDGFTQSIKDDK